MPQAPERERGHAQQLASGQVLERERRAEPALELEPAPVLELEPAPVLEPEPCLLPLVKGRGLVY